MSVRQLKRDLAAVANPNRAAFLASYFKTGPGQYGEGDRFLGIPVPVQRKIALRYKDLPFSKIGRLLASPTHEHRFAAVEILVAQYRRAASDAQRNAVYDFYLDHTAGINNWDLVDTSAPYIVGEHLRSRDRGRLDDLAASPVVWERRMAIISTLTLIRHGEMDDALRISERLLSDSHDLIRKAVGWALRETGKVSRPALLRFISDHYAGISRTTLRYAIERFPADLRAQILAGGF
jgi:3-methyladenine DNA glycosylase AlkD